MVDYRVFKPPEEPKTPEEELYDVYSPDKVSKESEVLQEEVIASMPPLAHFLLKKQYNLKYFVRIPLAILLILCIYFFIGADALASGALFFILFFIVGYLTQARHISKDKTYFFESKKRGQIIKKEYSPYSRDFVVETDRTAIWAVPNSLINKGLFIIPGTPVSPLPANPGLVFVDFFDPKNRTCVLPANPDVANIALDTNMNPTLAKTFDTIADQLERIENMQQRLIFSKRRGLISDEEAREMMKDIMQAKMRIYTTNSEVKRDIFQHLQRQIPVLQDTVRYLKGGMFALVDTYVAEIIYKMLNRPIPPNIARNINKVRAKLGAPKVGEHDSLIRRMLE